MTAVDGELGAAGVGRQRTDGNGGREGAVAAVGRRLTLVMRAGGQLRLPGWGRGGCAKTMGRRTGVNSARVRSLSSAGVTRRPRGIRIPRAQSLIMDRTRRDVTLARHGRIGGLFRRLPRCGLTATAGLRGGAGCGSAWRAAGPVVALHIRQHRERPRPAAQPRHRFSRPVDRQRPRPSTRQDERPAGVARIHGEV